VLEVQFQIPFQAAAVLQEELVLFDQ